MSQSEEKLTGIKKLEERLVYYRDFYNNFTSGDSEFAVRPQLVLLCEDSKHMAETFKEIVMNKLEIPNINIYYTTDLLQNEESMQKNSICICRTRWKNTN